MVRSPYRANVWEKERETVYEIACVRTCIFFDSTLKSNLERNPVRSPVWWIIPSCQSPDITKRKLLMSRVSTQIRERCVICVTWSGTISWLVIRTAIYSGPLKEWLTWVSRVTSAEQKTLFGHLGCLFYLIFTLLFFTLVLKCRRRT